MESRILVSLAAAVSGYFEVFAQAQLKSIESVEYDSLNNRYLISNSTNIIAQSATGGSLSVFGKGAASQYGMEILKDVLYAVIGQAGVKGYDLDTGSEEASAPIAGNWYISCWLPQPGVFKLAPDFSGSPVAMPGTFSGPADMDYNPVADVVAVPNTSSKTGTLIQLDNPVAIQPRSTVNKMKSQGVLKWTAGGTVIFDANGRKGSGAYNVRGRSVPMFPRSAE